MFYKNLKYFVQTCQCSSIAEAADKLFISRQALSLTLRRFEEEVGMPLFERNVRGVRMTVQGEAFYFRCRAILQEYEDAVSQVRKMGQKIEVLRIAFSLIALKILTTHAIVEFEKQHSGISVSFSSMVSADAWEALNKRKLDFVCSIRPPEEYGFFFRLVKKGSPRLLVAEFSPLASKKRITLEDLKSQTLFNSTELQQLTSRCQKSGIELRQRYFTNDPALISEAVAKDVGVYAVPQDTLSVFRMDGIVAVPFEEGLLDLNLYLTCRNPDELTPMAREFADYLCSLGGEKQSMYVAGGTDT